ncbi:MAG: RNA-guided endonuclease InsQ/TnpB family protein, partial [Candidatus Kariarchaeaceae archaeon]
MKSQEKQNLNRVECIALSRSATKSLIPMFVAAYHLAYNANLVVFNNYIASKKAGKLINWNYSKLCWWMRSKKQYKKYWLPQLGSRICDQVVRQVDNNWNTYFKAKKAYGVDPSKFKAKPKSPRFDKPNLKDPKYHILPLHNLQIEMDNGKIQIKTAPAALKKLNLKSTIAVSEAERIRSARISTPHDGVATFHLNYEILVSKPKHSLNGKPEKIIAIDIGVNNLLTVANNFNKEPVVINGKPIKSINHRYNKEKARLVSIYYKLNQKFRGKLNKISLKRKRKIDDYFHKTSRWLINYCLDNKVDTIVIGKNDDWKQSVNLGKKTNQKFVYIPFYRLLEMIVYKAEVEGVQVLFTEESYTSKCSFLDGEFPKAQTSYSGKRVKRGLFRSADGTLADCAKYSNVGRININADVNGALNIGMKAFPDLFALINKDEFKHLHP